MLMHYDQVKFISEKQRDSNFGKLLHVIYTYMWIEPKKNLYDHLYSYLKGIFIKFNFILI